MALFKKVGCALAMMRERRFGRMNSRIIFGRMNSRRIFGRMNSRRIFGRMNDMTKRQ